MADQALQAFIKAHSSMPDEVMARIMQRFVPATVAKGENLLQEGQVNDRYFVIADGWMRSFSHDTDGDEVTTAFHGPGHVVFDADSFFMRTPSKENIVALSDTLGCELSFAALDDLFHEFPEFREMGRAILAKALVAAKQRMLGMITMTAEERYAQLLTIRPELFQHASLKHIASFLGITDTSLSRIRKEVFKK